MAALAGALGAALGQMAIRVTQEKKNYQQHADRYAGALGRLASSTSTLLEFVDADADAYGRVMAAYKLPKNSPEREEAIQKAIVHATDIPSRTAHCAAEALIALEDLSPVIHPNVASDLRVGLRMLRSSLHGAITNMRTNLKDIKDGEVRTRYENLIAGWEQTLKGNFQ